MITMTRLGGLATTVAASSLLALLTVAQPSSAAPTPSPQSVPKASCATGRVQSLADRLAIREEPNINSTSIEQLNKGDVRVCVGGVVVLGGRYTACGVSNANGWLILRTADGRYGYSYLTCFNDV